MEIYFRLLHIFTLLTLALASRPLPETSQVILLPSSRQDDSVYCESWRFSVETNDAGTWTTVPTRCLAFVKTYMIGPRYQSDTYFAAEPALSLVKSLNVSADGMDAWVFGVDDTLLSCLPYYELHGYGTEAFNEDSFYEWASLAEAPPIAASWVLYKKLQELGYTIFILTGRDESVRSVTEANLRYAGYTDWKRLIMRGNSDLGTLATDYKGGKMKELVKEGYRIRGNSGDQWSDLLGFSVGHRSFKLPNVITEVFDEESFYEWTSLAIGPALPASLKLYRELQQLGFTIFILTGRDEHVRETTAENLRNAGYSDWKELFLRAPSDKGVPPTVFKSGKRQELVDAGYRIRGNSGDQWSDLLGFAIAQRSFKLPNLLYYLP